MSKGASKGASKGVPKGASKGAPKFAPKGSSKGASKSAPKGSSKGVSKGFSKGSAKGGSKSKVASKGSPKGGQKNGQKSSDRSAAAKASTVEDGGAVAGEQKKRKRKFRKGRKAKAEKSASAPQVEAPLCRNRHAMDRRETNPRGYANKACCDVCGLENLPKKSPYFFHCSFCRWDICPKCASKPPAGEHDGGAEEGRRKRRRIDDDASAPLKRPAAETPKPAEEPGFTRARREIWLPTDANAVSRAPLDASVVSDWVEGVPV